MNPDTGKRPPIWTVQLAREGDLTSWDGKAFEPNKGWCAIWSQPSRWSTPGPAARHRDRVNVRLFDGRVESLTVDEIRNRELTGKVLPERRR